MALGAGIGGALTALGTGLGRQQEREDALKQLLLSLGPNLKDRQSVETAMELLGGADKFGSDIDVDAIAAFGQDPYRERVGKAKQFMSTIDESSPYLEQSPGDILSEFNIHPGSPGAEAAGMVDQGPGPWDPSKAHEFADVSAEGGVARRQVPHAWDQIQQAQAGRQRGFDRTSKRAGITAAEQGRGTTVGTMGGRQDFIEGMTTDQKTQFWGDEPMYAGKGRVIGQGMGAEALTDSQQTALYQKPAFFQAEGREQSAALNWDPENPIGWGKDNVPGVSRRDRLQQQVGDSAGEYAANRADRIQVVPHKDGFFGVNLDNIFPAWLGDNAGATRRLPEGFKPPTGRAPTMIESIYQSMVESGMYGGDRNQILASPEFRAAIAAAGEAAGIGLGGGGAQTPEEIAAEQAKIDEIIRALEPD